MPSFSAVIDRRYRNHWEKIFVQDLTSDALNEIDNALRFQSIDKIRLGSSATNNRINKVGDDVNEGMFVTDNMAWRPPVLDIGMVWFGDDDVAKSACVRGIPGSIKSQSIHLLQIKRQRTATAIYFKAELILAARCKAGRFQVQHRAIFKPAYDADGIVDVYLGVTSIFC